MLIRLWPVLAVTSSLSTDAAMIAGTTNKKAKRDIYFREYKREGYYNSIMKTDVKLSVIDAFVIRNNDKTVIKVETIMSLSSVFGAVVLYIYILPVQSTKVLSVVIRNNDETVDVSRH